MKIALIMLLGLIAGCRSVPPDPLDVSRIHASPKLEVPRTHTPPKIDGVLDDTAWSAAGQVPGLVPARGSDAVQAGAALDTTVRVLWNENFLFIAFDCRDGNIRLLPETPRDGDIYKHDVVEVFLDPDGSASPVYEIVVSPLNQVLDAVHLLTAPAESDESGKMPDTFLKQHFWSFRARDFEGLKTAATRDKEGWQVEIAIPAKVVLRTLGRKTFASGDRIRANLLRYDWGDPSTGDRHLGQGNWSPVFTGCPHISPGEMGMFLLTSPGKSHK